VSNEVVNLRCLGYYVRKLSLSQSLTNYMVAPFVYYTIQVCLIHPHRTYLSMLRN